MWQRSNVESIRKSGISGFPSARGPSDPNFRTTNNHSYNDVGGVLLYGVCACCCYDCDRAEEALFELLYLFIVWCLFDIVCIRMEIGSLMRLKGSLKRMLDTLEKVEEASEKEMQ